MQIRNHIPRPEHPRPDFMRDTFYNLNGEWEFAFDDAQTGLRDGWQRPGHHLDKKLLCLSAINVQPVELDPQMKFTRLFGLGAASPFRNR